MAKYYLRVEGVNLDNFIYDTADLSTIRGGSLMLLNSIDQLANMSFSAKLEPISTGASVGLFAFEAPNVEQAENLRHEIENELKQDLLEKDQQGKNKPYSLKHATFVVDIQPASENFVFDIEAIVTKNRWRQIQQPSLSIPTHNSTSKDHCEVDLVRPAVASMTIAEKETQVSGSVKIRREYGLTQKYKFYQRLTGQDIGDKFVHDLDELTSDETKGNLHHKMAVIYIDGNKFGNLRREKCDTEDKLREFDQYIKNKRKFMLVKYFQNLVTKDKEGWLTKQNEYRIETLIWGGDEILWVVPAWQGWNMLSFFYQETKDWQLWDGTPLTHAAGIVFCHHNAAINRIKQLAHYLSEQAKMDRSKNLFTYQVLESFDYIGRDLDEFRKEICPLPRNPNDLILAGEEMSLVSNILNTIKSDEKFPKRKIYTIVDRLLSKAGDASNVIKETYEKLGDKKQLLVELDRYFGGQLMKWIHLQQLWDYVGL